MKPWPTIADLDKEIFYYAWHANAGYVRGITADVHKGYGWGFRSRTWPRLSFEDRIMDQRSDARDDRVWYVDGQKTSGLDAALLALQKPAQVTPTEQAALDLFPDGYVPVDPMLESIEAMFRRFGSANAHNEALIIFMRLQEKGQIEYEPEPEEPRAKPGTEASFEAMLPRRRSSIINRKQRRVRRCS